MFFFQTWGISYFSAGTFQSKKIPRDDLVGILHPPLPMGFAVGGCWRLQAVNEGMMTLLPKHFKRDELGTHIWQKFCFWEILSFNFLLGTVRLGFWGKVFFGMVEKDELQFGSKGILASSHFHQVVASSQNRTSKVP